MPSVMDPRRNVFYQYRGPSPAGDEFLRDRQLENNLTKSLLNILRHTSARAGRAALLSLLGRERTGRRLARFFQDGPLETYTQTTPPDVHLAAHRAVLLITGPHQYGPGEFRDDLRAERLGRPDAWICSQRNGATLLIEAKLGGRVLRSQISRHLKSVGWPRATPVIATVWSDWFEALAQARKTLPAGGVDAFLLDQFLEYLEAIGMAPFTGFLVQDFDFFLHHEPTYRARLRQKLRQFAKLVHERLDPGLRRLYREIYVGNIRTDREGGAWVGFRRPGAPSEVRHCNFTITINRDRLEFNSVVSYGRSSDRRKSIGVFARKLRASPQAFEEVLAGLGAEYAISVFARTRRDGSVPPGRAMTAGGSRGCSGWTSSERAW